MISVIRTSALFLFLFPAMVSASGCSSAPEDKAPPVMSALEALSADGADSSDQNAGSPPPPDTPGSPADSDGVPTTGTYRVKFETTKGDFVVEVHRDWAPIGADHFYQLVKSGFYNDCRLFRVIDGFMVQFGIAGDPKVQARWRESLPDDPVKQSNQRGFITYAKTNDPNSRTTQVFINYGDNARLDADGFAPFGQVIEGMSVVDSFYSRYGEAASRAQPRIQAEGNAFLDAKFPSLDSIIKASIVEEPAGDAATPKAADGK